MCPRALAVLVSLVCVLAAATPAVADVTPPSDDPFYKAPEGLAAAAPGQILRSRPAEFTLNGINLPYRSYQLLYRTNDSKDRPEAAVTSIIVPQSPAPAGGRRVVSYQTAEDSLGTQCAPSYTLRTGTEREIALVVVALLRGWAVVAPDYEGPESQYGAGRQAGHAVLDSLRAARRFAPAGLPANGPVGLWGYSGGGLATAWAAQLQPSYAPDIKLTGVAGGGVPADVEAVARQIDGGFFGGILFAAALGIERAYPEMDLQSILNAKGRALVESIKTKCVTEIANKGANVRSRDMITVPDALAVPRIKKVLAENMLGEDSPQAPTYLYHASADQLIPVRTIETLVRQYCADGATVHYYKDYLSEHVVLVATGALGALQFLQDRFDGRPAPNDCPAAGVIRTGPALRARLTRTTFRVGKGATAVAGRARRGTRLRLHIGRTATVTVSISRARGRTTRAVGTITRRYLRRGVHDIPFSGRIAGRKLAPGNYRARITANDLRGRAAQPLTLRFRVVR